MSSLLGVDYGVLINPPVLEGLCCGGEMCAASWRRSPVLLVDQPDVHLGCGSMRLQRGLGARRTKLKLQCLEVRCLSSSWSSYEEKKHELRNQGISIRRLKLKDGDNKPRNILEEIIWYKETEVAEMKAKLPLYEMRSRPTKGTARDFVGALKSRAAETRLPALIAEVKKASPSRGVIQPDFEPVRIAKAYERGGAACLSVLTDAKYFQGSFDNLSLIRDAEVQCPLLCKEFIIDPWQVYFARTKGADAVLLIAAVLSNEELVSLMKVAKLLGMAALVEVHDEKEMDRVLGLPGIELIGINNRNLETFEVDINNTVRLLQGSRGDVIRALDILVVGESGLFTPDDIALVQNAGVRAVLVGESLVKQNDPAAGIAGLFGKNISRDEAQAVQRTHKSSCYIQT